MEVLFHLAFTLVKIALLASGYAALLLGLARLLARFRPHSWLARQARQPRRLRRHSRAGFAAALFLFSLTYWGDHGLGDSARVPLGYGEAVEQVDLTTHFDPSVPVDRPGDRSAMDTFAVADGVLCAAYGDGTYFTYDLVTKRYQEFVDGAAYNAYAADRGLPRADQFELFSDHYGRYWHGWRFWLLA